MACIRPMVGKQDQALSVGFIVDAIGDAKALLDAKNIIYKEDDGKSGHYLHFRDPDNTVLYFVQPKWKS